MVSNISTFIDGIPASTLASHFLLLLICFMAVTVDVLMILRDRRAKVSSLMKLRELCALAEGGLEVEVEGR